MSWDLTGLEDGASGWGLPLRTKLQYLFDHKVDGTTVISDYAPLAGSVRFSTSATVRGTADPTVCVLFICAADPAAVKLTGDLWLRIV